MLSDMEYIKTCLQKSVANLLIDSNSRFIDDNKTQLCINIQHT